MSVDESHIELLRKCKLFFLYTHDELVNICALLEEESYGDGCVIFKEGDIGDRLYVVAEGNVKLTQTIVGAKRINRDLGTLGAGAFFGEMALIDNTARSATAFSVGSTRLFFLTSATLDRELNKGNSAVSKIIKESAVTLSFRVRTIEGIISDLLTGVYELDKDAELFPKEMTLREMLQYNRRVLMQIIQDIARRDEINRMKNEFVAMVSHELKNPLTSLLGSIDLLAGGMIENLTPAASEMFMVAHESMERLIRLIYDVLDIEKMESGIISLDIRQTDIQKTVGQSVGEMKGLASERGVLLIADAESFVIKADPDRVLQVLDNLLGNAMRYSPGGGEVRVMVRRQNGTALFSVSDQGPGIPAEFRSKVFQKFQQAQPTAGGKKQGTGLGLAICKAIVEGHGGKIWFETEEGKGTTFLFALPVDDTRVK